jgi:hypothetical protein
MEETIRREKCLYKQQREKPTFRKACDDKKRFKKEQRQKGSKPSFFRNSPWGQSSFKEPRKVEGSEHMPRPPPMECWHCKGNHRYKDCPIEKTKQELSILFNKLKQWRIWAAECRGSTQPWTISKRNFNRT